MSDKYLICVALSNEIVVVGELVQETDKAIALRDVASVHHVKPDPEEGIIDGSIVVSELFPSCVNLAKPVCFSYDQVVATFSPSSLLLEAYDDWVSKFLEATPEFCEISDEQ